MNSTSLYAAIDLGSNSFHMLVVREVAGSIQTLTRIKRKVRLAAGLNGDNELSVEAMERGWQCLRLFAERLQDIPHPQIRVVATATLRIAVNADVFIAKAQEILSCPVQVISGEEEARLIYQGVAHTTGGDDRRLVVDIGGASTELVTGTGAQTTSLFSLSMGCVTWLERYFADRSLTKENFDLAEAAARGHDVRTQINGYLVRNRATTLASALAFPARLLAAQGAMQCTSGAFVGVDSLIDRLVADGRLLVGLEVTGDLFRTPRFSQLGFDESPCLGCNTRTVLTGPHAGL